MANLRDIATGQMQAVSNRRWPKKLPLEEEVHAELPAKLAEGRTLEEKRQFDTELAQEKELSEKDLAQREAQTKETLTQEETQHQENLAELARQQEENIAQRKEEMRIAGEQAEQAEGVTAIGMGVQGGKLLSDWAKSVKGVGGEYGGMAAPMVTGFGVGYGIGKLTGNKLYGMAGGALAGAGAAYLQAGTDATTMTLSSISGFLGGLF